MPITLPNLDDREFTDLVAEAKSMIPQLAPSWTDHNPSDPGITLLELFAFLAEMLIYRTNRVTDANKLVFLELLMGRKWLVDHDKLSLSQQITKAIEELRTEERVIGNEDFEKYALKVNGVARAYCHPLKNYELTTLDHAPAHISLVIVPTVDPFDVDVVKNSLAQRVKNELEPRLLITTKLHIVPASYLKLGVNVALTIFEDYKENDVQKRALNEIEKYFHPLTGGKDGKGWKLGQWVYLADIYQLLDQLPGVDFIEPISDKLPLTLDKASTPISVERAIYVEVPTKEDPTKKEKIMVGIKLQENELPQFVRYWSFNPLEKPNA